MVQICILMVRIPFKWFKFAFELFESFQMIRHPFEWLEVAFKCFECHLNGPNLHFNASNLIQMVQIYILMVRIPFEWFKFCFLMVQICIQAIQIWLEWFELAFE